MSSTVAFSARVPIAEYLRFKDRFPQYGASQWFINAALRAFNDRLSQEPSLEAVIEESIQSAIELNRLIALATRGIGKERDDG